jgi:hypothetical protein
MPAHKRKGKQAADHASAGTDSEAEIKTLKTKLDHTIAEASAHKVSISLSTRHHSSHTSSTTTTTRGTAASASSSPSASHVTPFSSLAPTH